MTTKTRDTRQNGLVFPLTTFSPNHFFQTFYANFFLFSLILPALSFFIHLFSYSSPPCLSATCVWESVHNRNGGRKTERCGE